MSLYADHLFAPVDLDLHMERIAGGNETEVYRTDDLRFVVKVKSDQRGTAEEALARAKQMRAAAEEFVAVLGPQYTIPSAYFIARDSAGEVQVVVVQPYVGHARPLSQVNFAQLTPAERERVATQLEDIIGRAVQAYWRTGRMPDIYGRVSRSKAERRLLNAPRMIFWRLWSFLVKRNLLRSHNLLLTDTPERQIILIDYDALSFGWLYRTTYYLVRQLLFLRDYLLIQLMRKTGKVPKE